jgi:hypothetical protein
MMVDFVLKEAMGMGVAVAKIEIIRSNNEMIIIKRE